MANRFIASDIFKDDFMRSLRGAYKAFWIFLFCDCNASGIWSVDFEAASLYCGGKIEKDKAEKIFAGKFRVVNGGGKWFLPGFIEFQYKGVLCQENKAHQKTIEVLTKFDLLTFWKKEVSEKTGKEMSYFKLITHEQGGSKPLYRGDKDMDKDKDKEEDKAEVKEEAKVKVGPVEEIIFPYDSIRFREKWSVWMDYRKEISKPYKSKKSEQAALKELSEFDEDFSIELIDRSIAGGYQGLVFDQTKQNYERRKNTRKSSTGFPTKSEQVSQSNRDQFNRLVGGGK